MPIPNELAQKIAAGVRSRSDRLRIAKDWIAINDGELFMRGEGGGAARQQCREETGLAISSDVFKEAREMAFDADDGLLWAGYRHPLLDGKPALSMRNWGKMADWIRDHAGVIAEATARLEAEADDPRVIARVAQSFGERFSPYSVKYCIVDNKLATDLRNAARRVREPMLGDV